MRQTDNPNLFAETGPTGFFPPLRDSPMVETQTAEESASRATQMCHMTDEELRDLIDQCNRTANAVIAAARCQGRIDAGDLAHILFFRFTRVAADRRHWPALKRAAYRLIIDQVRREAKRRTFDERSSHVVEEDPVEGFDRREAAVVLLTKIRATLTPTENALLAFFLECEAVAGEHGAYAVVGEALGKRANTIAVCVSRIRLKAARFLDEYEKNFLD